ncbi:MAG: hypothetical protein HW380_1693 [Magnetococcales bacterium]|nr:hypothetical protein [Magnetococcales bacterium]
MFLARQEKVLLFADFFVLVGLFRKGHFLEVSEKQNLAKNYCGGPGGDHPICADIVIGKNFCGGPGGIIPPGGGLEAEPPRFWF